MWALFLKCILGAAVVLLISILSKSKAFYIAGLVPLFPTFALIAHVIVYQQQGAAALQKNRPVWAMVADSLCHLFSGGLCAGNTHVDVVVFGGGDVELDRGSSRFNLCVAVSAKLMQGAAP